MRKDTQWRVANAVGFQAFWFACILGQSQWLALPLALLLIHLTLVSSKRRELLIVGICIGVGLLSDSILTLVGLFIFQPEQMQLGLIPVWLVLLWAGLGATFLHSFSALFNRPGLMIMVFTLLAPVSYFAGERLGAVSLAWPIWQSYLGIALTWLVASSVIIFAFRFFDNKQWITK